MLISRRVALIFLLCSCSKTSLIELPATKDFKPLPAAESQQVLQELNRQSNELTSLKGSADVTLAKGLIRKNFFQTLVYQTPGNARVESFVPGINQLISLIIIDDERIYVRDGQRNKNFEAALTEENISALVYLPLFPRDLALLFAGIGLIADRDSLEIGNAANLTRLAFEREGNKIEQYFQRCIKDGRYQLRALRISKIDDSSELLSAALTYSDCSGPQSLDVELSPKGISGKFVIRRLQMNSEVKPELFLFPVANKSQSTKVVDDIF